MRCESCNEEMSKDTYIEDGNVEYPIWACAQCGYWCSRTEASNE